MFPYDLMLHDKWIKISNYSEKKIKVQNLYTSGYNKINIEKINVYPFNYKDANVAQNNSNYPK